MLPETRFGYLKRYCDLGFSIIPLDGKKPFWADWPKQCTNNETRALQIWKQYPTANVGIVLGSPSNMFALDFDAKHGGLASLEKLEYEHGTIDTLRADTGGGGVHAFYRLPNFEVITRTKWMPGVEVRGSGAQVVAADSVHPETKLPYSWAMLDDELDWEHILPAPQWLIDKLQNADTRREVRQELKRPAEKIGKGGRHMTMVSMAGILRHRIGATAEEIDGFLQVFNQTRNDPPYDAAHVSAIARSMMTYTPDAPPLAKACSRLYSKVKEQHAKDQEFLGTHSPVTAEEIMQGNYQAPAAVIADMIHVGLTVLAGPPKIGKSFLGTQMAIAVATGAPLFGTQKIARPGKIAYFSLEESAAQVSGKLNKLHAGARNKRLSDIGYYYQMETLPGAVDDLRKVIEHTAPTMVIIDSYTSIAGQTGRNDDIVTKDYRHIKLLSDLGKEMDVAIVLIHHLKKQSRGDTFTDAFAGTGGLTRAADCLAKIEPDGEVFLLEGKGREIPEYSFAMRKDFRDGTGWYIVAAGDAAKATEAREDIFELLKDEGAHTPSDIARKLGKNGGTVRRLLKKMREASQVQRGGDGKYFNLGREL